MAAGGVIAYEDIFEILDQDADGKRFDRVSRFRCRSAFESDLQIDINIDIYKLEVRPRVDHPPRSAAALHPPPSRLDAEVDNCGPFAHPRLSPPSASSPQIGTKFTLVLAPTLSLDGTPEDPAYDQSGKESLADSYEYVMYGKVFKKQDENEGGIRRSVVNISFGGLLMQLKADPKNLQDVDIDNRLYVLIRKIS